jgi:hypothetical protein
MSNALQCASTGSHKNSHSCTLLSFDSVPQLGLNLQAYYLDTNTKYQQTHNKTIKMVAQPAKMPPMNPATAKIVPVVMTIGIGKSSAKPQLDIAICTLSTNTT